jgi:hypothetical protein
VIAANGATVGWLIDATPGAGSVVARDELGVWLAVPIGASGVLPTSFPALYADAACATPAFVPLDSTGWSLLRLLQVVNAGDSTGYFAGDPVAVRTFEGMSPLGRPDLCESAAAWGWNQPTVTGPVRTLDLSGLPAPYTIKPPAQ